MIPDHIRSISSLQSTCVMASFPAIRSACVPFMASFRKVVRMINPDTWGAVRSALLDEAMENEEGSLERDT